MSFLSGIGRVAGAALGSSGGAIGSAIGGKAGNIIGGILSGVGSSAENAASMRQQYEYQKNLQQLSHQYSLETLDKQQSFAASQSEKDRQWNSASSQAQRLRDAGVNPFFALSGSAPSMVQSQGAGSVSPVSAPGAPLGNSVGSQLGMQAMTNIAEQEQLNRDSSLKQSVEQLNRTDALTRYARNSADIILSMKKAGLISAEEARTKVETDISNLNRDYYEAIAGKRVESFNLDVQLKQIEKELGDFNVKHLDERFKIEMASARASIVRDFAAASNLTAQINLYKAESFHYNQLAWNVMQITRQAHMTDEQTKRYIEATVQQVEGDAKKAGAQGDTSYWKETGQILSSFLMGFVGLKSLGILSKAKNAVRAYKAGRAAAKQSKAINDGVKTYKTSQEALYGVD